MSTKDSHDDAAVFDSLDIGELSAGQTQTTASTDCADSVVQTNPQFTAATPLLQLHNGTFSNYPDMIQPTLQTTPSLDLAPVF